MGHVNPTLPLVQALVERGDRVIAFNTEAYRGRFEAVGAEFRPYALDYDWEPGQDTLAPFEAMSRILGESDGVITRYLTETRQLDPELILYDSMCPWGKQLARLAGKPAVCSSSIMYAGLANLRAWPRNTELSRGMMRDPLAVARGIARYERKAFELWLKWHVSSPVFIDFFANPGDMTLMYTSRYFQVGGDLFDKSFRFVGPMMQERHDAPPFPFEWLGGRRLVYVSLGTLFNNRADFFRTCAEAFRESEYAVVMAVGQRIRGEDLGALPENVLTREYVPQLELLPRAALFITHGGMNSVSEAAWFGRPMLLAPQVGDQVFIAHQTEKLGAGRQIDSKTIGPGELRAAAEGVMADERYAEGSARIGDSLRASGGVKQAVQELEAFRTTARSSHQIGLL